MIYRRLLIFVLIFSNMAFAAIEQTDKQVDVPDDGYQFVYHELAEDFDHNKSRQKLVSDILGKKNENNVRVDLVKSIKDIADGNRIFMDQLYVYSRAHDAFLISETPEEAYNAYLMMNAIKNCMSSFKDLGRVGANSLLMELVDEKVDSEVRRMALVKAESLLVQRDFPPLKIHDNYRDYCRYTKTVSNTK